MTTRRVFLKNGSLALVSLGFAPMFIARTAQAAQARKKVLVAIFQRGAVDGLNMVVPFGDNAYYTGPAVDRDSAAQRERRRGRSRRLLRLAPADAAALPICSSAASSRSCTRADRRTRRARTSTRRTTWRRHAGREEHADGWLNRYLHAQEHEKASPFRAVALASNLPRTLQGKAPALAINQLSQFGVHAGAASNSMESTFEAQYAAAADTLLAPTGKEAFDAVKMLQHRSRRLHAGQRRRVSALAVSATRCGRSRSS